LLQVVVHQRGTVTVIVLQVVATLAKVVSIGPEMEEEENDKFMNELAYQRVLSLFPSRSQCRNAANKLSPQPVFYDTFTRQVTQKELFQYYDIVVY
jgi:hypothetical protein